LLPRTFSFGWWGRHYGAADSTNAIVDGASVLLNVIVTSQVERLAPALNVSLRKERADVHLKARRFRHCASQVLDYMDVAVSFVKTTLSFALGGFLRGQQIHKVLGCDSRRRGILPGNETAIND
jgi:hypothetical protein